MINHTSRRLNYLSFYRKYKMIVRGKEIWSHKKYIGQKYYRCVCQSTDDSNYSNVIISWFWILGVCDIYQILKIKCVVIFYLIWNEHLFTFVSNFVYSLLYYFFKREHSCFHKTWNYTWVLGIVFLPSHIINIFLKIPQRPFQFSKKNS